MLRDARRTATLTGGAAMEDMLKKSFMAEYTTGAKSTSYVDIQADRIAEPSQPSHFVKMLDALPGPLAAHYAEEANVLRGGETNPDMLADIRRASKTIGGTTSEYVKYFRRPEAKHFWIFKPASVCKSFCSFKTVMKKDGFHQRKILATLEKNMRWGKPPRNQTLGLWGGGQALAPLFSPGMKCT